MTLGLRAAFGLTVFLGACVQPEPAPIVDGTALLAEAAELPPCADDGPRFPITGLCIGRSVAYLEPSGDWQPPEGCTWAMNEAWIGDGTEALLYRAAVCNGVTTTLQVSGGAQSASVEYVTSALGGDVLEGQEVIRLFVSDPANPQWHMKDILRDANETGEVECEIRPAGIAGWPEGALVIAPTAEERAAMPQDEPVAACGDWGLDEDSAQYWEVRQGYEWFFHLGQDQVDFDPNTVTHIVRDAEGNWQVAE
ncbi:MAG: hypothetical protein KDA53_13140 [Hyphomonas sp.]|nr:hypothetical protein [Hyphomonas sp.]